MEALIETGHRREGSPVACSMDERSVVSNRPATVVRQIGVRTAADRRIEAVTVSIVAETAIDRGARSLYPVVIAAGDGTCNRRPNDVVIHASGYGGVGCFGVVVPPAGDGSEKSGCGIIVAACDAGAFALGGVVRAACHRCGGAAGMGVFASQYGGVGSRSGIVVSCHNRGVGTGRHVLVS